MDKPWKHYTKGKKPATKDLHTVSFHSYEMSTVGKSVQTESRSVVAYRQKVDPWLPEAGSEGGEWGMTADYMSLPWAVMKVF